MGFFGMIGLVCSVVVAAEPQAAGLTRSSGMSRDQKGTTVSFRAVSNTEQAGFDQMTFGANKVYIARQAWLSGADVASVETQVDGSSASMTLMLAPGVSAPAPIDKVAVILDGRVSAIPSMGNVGNGRVTLRGMLPGEVQRLGRVFDFAPVQAVGATLTVVPRTTSVRPGETVTVDVFLSRVSNLRAYQVALDATGTKGALRIEDMLIDTSHPQYVFGTEQTANAVDKLNGRAVNATFTTKGYEVGDSAYLATYTFRATAEAAGEFKIRVRANQDTALRDTASAPIGYQVSLPATIEIGLTSSRPSEKR